MNFYWKVGIGVGVLLLVALVAVFFLTGGEEREVEAVVQEIADAARKGDADRVITYISNDYGRGPEDYDDVCAKIRQNVGPDKYEDMELKELEISVLGDTATVKVKIRVVRPKIAPIPYFERVVEADFRKEGNTWRVISARSKPVKFQK